MHRRQVPSNGWPTSSQRHQSRLPQTHLRKRPGQRFKLCKDPITPAKTPNRMHRIIPAQDGIRWNPIWLRQQMLRKMFKRSAKFFCERRMVKKQEGICRLTKQTKSPLYTEPLTILSADRTKGLLQRILLLHKPCAGIHIFFPQLLEHCRVARQDSWPLLQTFVEKAQVSFVFGSGKKWEFCRQYLVNTQQKGTCRLTKHTKKTLSTESLTIFSADRTTLLHRILLPHKPRTEKNIHVFATATTLPHCVRGHLAFASDVCGLWKNRK